MNAEQVIIVMEDGSKIESSSFAVVIDGEEVLDAKLMYNCDVILLGQMIQMAASAYHNDMQKLSEEERKGVQDALQSLLEISNKENANE